MSQPAGTNHFSLNGVNFPIQDSDITRSFRSRLAVVDAAITVDPVANNVIAFTSITGVRAVTLPAASACQDQHFVIKDESGSVNGTTIKISFVGTVDGAVNPDAVIAAYGVKRIYSNGTAFFSA